MKVLIKNQSNGGNNGPSQPPKKSAVIRAEIERDADVFPQVEEGEFHAGIFGMVAGHQLVLRLRQVEGDAAHLRQPGDGEDQQPDNLRKQNQSRRCATTMSPRLNEPASITTPISDRPMNTS